ncbi:MAG: hypothetical protein A2086_04765 [Spirochaetes bacterium GWD1_27_9]|nr:MAG: hypothetical protein A2Z98_07755 [Spirochaetes bacterium GWB1_27_13]OHD25381.1 MAG: hypothetical protein A2Y34_10970 [Spirochaetes bacterium GWC1_27_15]OHD30299.1 MAG: hypothetical protein A2086_04765 [Spirochaetes bacterium GWD1_27_9]
MKERFLNIFLFLISLCFIACGIILIFFNTAKLPYLDLVHTSFDSFFGNPALSSFFIAFLGTFVFAWGIFFFLTTIFIVMEIKNTNMYGFMFFTFTLWAIMAQIVSFLNKFYFLMIVIGILYGILFIPYFISLPMKSKDK